MPRIVRDAITSICQPGQHEEQVTKAIEILDGVGWDRRLQPTGERHHPPLCPATDRAGDVQFGRQRRARRQNETLEWLNLPFVFVDRPLERLDVLHRDPFLGVTGRSQLGAEVEQFTLDAAQKRIKRGGCRQRADDSEMAVEFVHRAEGFDAGMILRDPRPAKETGFTGVARLRVNLHPCRCLRAAGRLTVVAKPSILVGMSKTFKTTSLGRGYSWPFSRFSTGRKAKAFGGREWPLCATAGGIRTAVLSLIASAMLAGSGRAAESLLEHQFFAAPVRLTEGFPKAGEGYFSPDGRQICFQAFPEGYPFYQIYVQAFDPRSPRPTTPRRISPGRGRTTCSWFSPDGSRLLFASSHLDPDLTATEQAARDQAAEDARTGRRRRYQWDFDPHMEIFAVGSSTDGTAVLDRLTNSPGYDAECSYSPDGREVLFVSDRDGDPDIFLMNADGTNVRQLTNEPGYDGGPFFSPDGRWIAYRTDRIEKDQLQIHVMKADGSDDVAITSGAGVRWAPFWHPTRPWLIWTGADHSDPTQRPNYDLWIARYDVANGRFRCGAPLRLTDHPGADVLPSFSPDGTLLMWTASRDGDGGGRHATSQLWLAKLDLAAIDTALVAPPAGGDDAAP